MNAELEVPKEWRKFFLYDVWKFVFRERSSLQFFKYFSLAWVAAE